jgi:hypothetical protein
MARRLMILNGALVLIALVAVAYVYRELRRAPNTVPTRRAAGPAASPGAPAAPGDALPGSYGVVASRNLFSPTRSEAPAAAVSNAARAPKPNLFGIVLRDGAPVAYLEDPTTRRVAGYRLGDSVAGGTVTQIGADHVVLNRPDGEVNVRLRDPSKPRPAAPSTGALQPGVPAAPGAPAPAVVPQQPGQAANAPLPPIPPPPGIPRRPLPPNLLRRLPPPAASDAPAQN